MIRKILNAGDGSPAPAGAGVSVAAFGKHPGWDDHIDDLGLDTERLVAVKRVLYMEGIRSNIDAGAWSELAVGEGLEEFGHEFAWTFGADQIVVGRMWSSSDGKGRTRYPMVVCVECRGVSWPRVAGVVMPHLARIEAACRETDAAQVVRSLIEQARTDLTAALASGSDAAEARVPGPRAALQCLATHHDMGANHIGYQRVLYAIHQEMSGYRRAGADSGTRTSVVSTRSQHIRVPACAPDAPSSVSLWREMLLVELDGNVPMLFFRPLAHDWLDIVVGEPTSTQLFVVRTTPRKTPLTTDIPYTLDDAFATWADGLLDAAPLVSAPPSPSRAGTPAPARGRRGPWLILGLLVIVAAAAGAAWMLFGPGARSAPPPDDGSVQPEPVPPRVESTADDTGPAITVARVDADGWERLCRAALDWLWELEPDELSAERQARYAEHEVLGPVVRRLRLDGPTPLEMNPGRIVGTPSLSPNTLMRQPPAAEYADAVQAAVTALDDVRDRLSGWVTSMHRRADGFEARGWPHGRLRVAANDLASFLNGDEAQGTMLDALDQAVLAGDRAAAVDAAWLAFEEDRAVIRDAEAPLSADFEAWVDATLAGLGPSSTLPEIASVISRLRRVAAEPKALFEGDLWRRDIDHAVVATLPPLARPETIDPDGAYFERWCIGVREARYRRLDPADDPRGATYAANRLDAVRGLVERLEGEFATPLDPAWAEQLTSAERDIAALAGRAWNGLEREGVEAEHRRIETVIATLTRTLQREITAQSETLETLQESLRQEVAISDSAVINERWSAYCAALIESQPDARALRDAADAGRAALVALNTALPPVVAGEAGMPTALVGAYQERRETALAALLNTIDPGATTPEAAVELAAKPAAELARWVERADGVRAEVEALDTWLAAAHAPEVPMPDGGTAYERLNALREIGEADFAGLLSPLEQRLELHATLAAEEDAGALAARIDAAELPALEHRFTAWRRLGQLPATGAADELKAEWRARAQLESAIRQQVGDAERQSVLREEIDVSGPARWGRHAEAATAPAVLEDALRERGRFGVRDEDLPAWLRCNIELLALRELAAAPEAADPASDEAIRVVIVLAANTLDAGGATAEAERLRQLVETAPPPPVDLGRVGPGAVPGWSLTDQDDSSLTYALSGTDVALRFVLVPGIEGEEGSAVYLAEHELSLEACSAIIDRAEAWADLRTLLPAEDPALGDARRGPRTWRWGNVGGERRFTRARAWLSPTVMDANRAYPRGLRAGRPTDDHPVQQLSPAAAVFIAGRAGCRLPSAGAWQAAARASGTPAVVNGRDATWRRQYDHIMALRAEARDAGLASKTILPDAGIFRPAGAGSDTAAVVGDDGVLWFEPVDSGGDGPWHHLVGNVAEFVAPDHALAASLATVPAAALPDRLAGAGLAVIGQSALSPVEDDAATPAPVPDAEDRAGYADVGVRLAFTARGAVQAPPPLGLRLRDLLSTIAYFRARDVGAAPVIGTVAGPIPAIGVRTADGNGSEGP